MAYFYSATVVWNYTAVDTATFFRDSDAQFELAKLYLTGEGVEVDHRKSTSWLSALTENGHPGAQALLADLFWRGKIVPKDEKRALALITLAVENAPAHERIWIEDTYQSVYCGLSAGVRSQSDSLVAAYRQKFSPRPGTEQQERLGGGLTLARTCSDGTPLPDRARHPVKKGGKGYEVKMEVSKSAGSVPAKSIDK